MKRQFARSTLSLSVPVALKPIAMTVLAATVALYGWLLNVKVLVAESNDATAPQKEVAAACLAKVAD